MKTKNSKRYRAALQVADLNAKYDINQATEIIKKMPGAKFDETVEISAFLGVDPKRRFNCEGKRWLPRLRCRDLHYLSDERRASSSPRTRS